MASIFDGAKTKIERLDLSSFTETEKHLLRIKTEELQEALNTKALFFKVIKSGKDIYLQAVMQFLINNKPLTTGQLKKIDEDDLFLKALSAEQPF